MTEPVLQKSLAFTYELPTSRIAQRPVYPYDSARLLAVSRKDECISSRTFLDLPEMLLPGDLLVFNDSKVIPARLFGTLSTSGGKVEILLTQELSPGVWRALGRPLKKLKPGVSLNFAAGIEAVVEERCSAQEVKISFTVQGRSFNEALAEAGQMPIPPYIRDGHSDRQDVTDYQSLFARYDGSVAAPTASLHFTQKLLETLTDRGVETVAATLHVGPASFLPLYKKDSEELQRPGIERFSFPEAVWQKILAHRSAGQRVIAVGTTMVRALESRVRNLNEETELFITPGFEFQIVDGIITNFHQPGTTHLLLVQAFIGKKLLEMSYQFALENEYRFLSYGDGMLLV